MIINKNTKKGKMWLASTEKSLGYGLEEVYGSYSNEKYRAWLWCIDKYEQDKNARGFRITARNSMVFTVAWDTVGINPKTGEVVPVRHIETSRNSYDVM